MKRNKFKIIIIFLFVCFFAAYMLAKNRDYPGSFEDDAWYINAARYMAGELEVKPDFSSRPLGVSFLIVPVIKLMPSSVSALEIYMILLFVLAVFLLYRLLESGLKQAEVFILTLLVGLCPLALLYSADVLSEVPYLLVTVIFIYLYRKKNPSLLLMSFTAAAAFYLKSAGILLFISALVLILLRKRHKSALYFSFYYLLFIFPYFLFLKNDSIDKYIFERLSTASAGGVIFFKHALFYFKNIFMHIVLFKPFNIRDSGIFNADMYFWLSIPAVALIFYSLYRNREIDMPLLKIYMPLYLLLHVMWGNVALRYLFPVYPFIIIYFFNGLKKVNRYVFTVITVASLYSYITADAKIISGSLKADYRPEKYTAETFEWIRKNIPDRRIMNNRLSSTLLYTGKKGAVIRSYRPSGLYSWAVKEDINYFCLFSMDYSQMSAGRRLPVIYSRQNEYALSEEKLFIPVYSNKEEKTRIWKRRTEAENAFLEAEKLLKQGTEAFLAGRKTEAAVKIERSISVFPHRAAPYAELAAVYMTMKDYENALKTVDSGLSLYPGGPYLLALKGKILSFKKEKKAALEYLYKARARADYLGLSNLKREVLRDISRSQN